MCLNRRCPKRHPHHCKYWTSKPEGCKRNETCQYLHLSSKRLSVSDIDNDRTLFTVYEDENEEESENESIQCDQCPNLLWNTRDLETHRKAIHITNRNGGYQECYRDSNETEESYRVEKDKEGKIQFTCKICEASFASQKVITQHYTVNGVGRDPGQLASHKWSF